LTTGPAGTYTDGDTSHVDALTSASSGYTASYDAAGDMTCRAPSSSLTCSGTATGQVLVYDQLRRLLTWKHQTNSPTTEGYVYDGEGNRVERAVTTNGTTTVTYTIGSYEDVTTVNGSTTITTYYGKSAVNANGTLAYLVDDGLGSVSESLSATGSVQGAQLFAPYGSVRYSTGSFPGPQAFTGQRQDGSGLAYFNARYYDPAAGQFTSADSVQGPNRDGYVAGNPETATDPSGHIGLNCRILDDNGRCVGSGDAWMPPTTTSSGMFQGDISLPNVRLEIRHKRAIHRGQGEGDCGRD
jgi:RHS repeat-associated protein